MTTPITTDYTSHHCHRKPGQLSARCRWRLFLLLAGILLISACTENPFMDVPRFQEATISGYVALNDTASPDQVYIWIENFDRTYFTDSDGFFEIPIPNPEVQGEGIGLNGPVDMHFFLYDYKLVSKRVLFSRGELTRDQDLLDNQGRFRQPVVLSRILKVTTTIGDTLYTLTPSGEEPVALSIAMELITFDYPVEVDNFRQSAGLLKPAYYKGTVFESVDLPEDTLIFDHEVYTQLHRVAIDLDDTLTWEVQMPLEKLAQFEPGTYRVYPYLIIHQPEMSEIEWEALQEIIEPLGSHYNVYLWDYHLLPMKRSDGLLEIPVRPEEEDDTQ